MAQPTPQAPTVATPTVNRGNGGRSEQPGTSNASAPRQLVDSVPSGSLVCSDTYIFIIVYELCRTVLGGPWGELFYALPPHSPVFIFSPLSSEGLVSGHV